MALVPAICTQCNAQLEVDDTKEAAICKHCGTAFIVEKAINNYNTYITNNNNFAGATININGDELKSLIELGHIAFDNFDFNKALEYANKALELSVNSYDAWLLKIKVMERKKKSISEITSCYKNAIKFAPNDIKEQVITEIYEQLLVRSEEQMQLALEANNKGLQELENSYVCYGPIKSYQRDFSYNLIFDHIEYAVKYKGTISNEYIINRNDYQIRIINIIKQYVECIKGDERRQDIYGESIPAYRIDIRKEYLTTLLDGLSVENSKSIDYDNIKVSVPQSTKGCYIATCVYGSYDCPQVWTLRRYRDYTLDNTWYGRAFIKIYYTISPTLVKWFGQKKWFKSFWKANLDKMVKILNTKGVLDTKYNDKY